MEADSQTARREGEVHVPRKARQPIIVCEGVCIAYDREDVIHDASVEVESGAFLPFVGPNGAGKTTLLRAILGLLKPREGRIDTPFAERPPGYVPQEKALDQVFPVSLRQIVAMGLYPELGVWGRATRCQRERVDAALAEFGLAEHRKKCFAELSGGMRQKALLARAFVSQADVFVMDEPTSELDEEAETEVLQHLYRLSAEEGKTVLISHHGLDRIAELAPSVFMFEHGRARMVRTEEAMAAR
jgi:ABC-type Mn2+/Zn2+ transport system ATPase subunit